MTDTPNADIASRVQEVLDEVQRQASQPVEISGGVITPPCCQPAQSKRRATGLSPRQMFVLDNACWPIRRAFVRGNPLTGLYLVGSAVKGDNSAGQRDVDVRLVLADDEYAALVEAVGIEAVRFLGLAIGQYLASVTGLPIDFQFQQTSTANEKHGGGWRNPIGTRDLDRYEGDAEYRIPPVQEDQCNS